MELIMTAREKFEARAEELGIYVRYDHDGAILPDGRVVVLVHIDGQEDDPYTEIVYPPFEELWKNPEFHKACKEEFYSNSDDDKFIANLARWLDIHDPSNKCPLFPVDLYWLTGGFELTWFNYKDDQTAEEIIKNLVKEHALA